MIQPFTRPFSTLIEADLKELVETGEPESRQLEYKQDLPGKSEKGKHDFLADVSALANSAGGVILYGVEENNRQAHSLPGLDPSTLDAELLRLEQTLRSGLEPRPFGVTIHRPIALSSGRCVLAVEVPRSLHGPHRIRDSSRIYGRHGNGIYQLDMAEIRAAFVGAEAFTERVRTFHAERLAKLLAGQGPLTLTEPAMSVLHILPLASFTPGFRCELPKSLNENPASKLLVPFGEHFNSRRHNFEGLLQYQAQRRERDNPERADSYVQLFRNGVIESVDTDLLAPFQNQKGLAIVPFRSQLVRALGAYLRAEPLLGVPPPYYVLLALLNVRDYPMLRQHIYGRVNQRPLREEHLILPEIVVEDADAEPTTLLKDTFDTLWNAFGFDRCHDYDESGQWQPKE